MLEVFINQVSPATVSGPGKRTVLRERVRTRAHERGLPLECGTLGSACQTELKPEGKTCEWGLGLGRGRGREEDYPFKVLPKALSICAPSSTPVMGRLRATWLDASRGPSVTPAGLGAMAKEGEIFLGAEQVPQGPPLGRTNNRKEEEAVKDRGGNMQERSPD